MWVLESLGEVVAGPFKSEAALAKKLGVSQQYVNRQLKKHEFLFHLDGKNVVAAREKAFAAGKQTFYTKEDMALILGVPQEAIDKVFRKKSSGVIQTPKGKIKIAKLKPGETPIPLQPKVRTICVRNDENEKQEFSSFAAAAKAMKIDPKTIPNALRAGKDSFTRKSDGHKFTIEILEPTPPKVTKQLVEEKAPARVEKEEEEEEEKPPEPAPAEEAAEDMKEELDEEGEKTPPKEELVYLGTGLWEKKTDEEPEETEDPFCDSIYKDECPGLGNDFDNWWFSEKRKLLKPGEKVERFVDTEKASRVLIVNSTFTTILSEYETKDFESDFYLSEWYSPDIWDYIRQYAHLGMLPILTPYTKEYIWRIQISPEEKTTDP